MKQSHLFTKTRKDAPKDEVAKNAQLLIRAGYIHKEMAGVYSLLPLGLKVINNIIAIIREEMNAIGGQEVVLSTLQQKETWEPTNQWDDKEVDVWFKTKLKNQTEVGLAVTHEAALTKLMKDSISSYRDVPRYIYQFQTKFRNEVRAKSGVMRTREFIMKDLYSFSKNEEEHAVFYEKAKQAYVNVFKKAGIGESTYVTFASGGMFAAFSHEFQTVTDAGEDIIYINKEKNIAINQEVFTDQVKKELGLEGAEFIEAKSVEVGNIFSLGTRFSDALDLKYKNDIGEDIAVVMGSYGIGPARLMGTIVETLSDENGIVWPESVAPFQAHLLCLATDDENVKMLADDIYRELEGNVLYDDRENVRGGEKFADADLMGMPYQIIVGKKSHQDAIEIKHRKTGKVETKSMSEIIEWLQSK